MPNPATSLEAFAIPLWQHLYAALMHDFQGWWRRLGDWESHTLRDALEATELRRPIYIAGLARAGSTILLEAVAAHPEVATHRYRDFWTMHTPYWSERRWQTQRQLTVARERSHGDGLLVTPDSPEAMEEILWMHFFPRRHDPRHCQILDASVCHPAFEQYYRDHIRKLLLARHAGRYAAKANYGVTRLTYLARLFPDVRIIIPVRAPREQIASLRKQHRLLTAAAQAHPRSVAYLDRAGHFEFGAHRRPLHLGDSNMTASIEALWRKGDEVRGWARYWAYVYRYLLRLLDDAPQLRPAVRFVNYEQLCGQPERVLAELLDHCRLAPSPEWVTRFATRLAAPSYYRPDFTAAEERAIEEETASVAAGLGYDVAAAAEPETAGAHA